VTIPALNREFRFEEREYVITEWSQKFTPAGVTELAGKCGFRVKREFQDDRSMFLVSLWTPDASAG
jgi:hypothetical protein